MYICVCIRHKRPLTTHCSQPHSLQGLVVNSLGVCVLLVTSPLYPIFPLWTVMLGPRVSVKGGVAQFKEAK